MTAYSTHLLRHTRYSIGQQLAEARRKRKMPLETLAKLTGLSLHRLDGYEMGRGDVQLRELLKIACALEIGIDRLFDRG